jgi:hypothetical protein
VMRHMVLLISLGFLCFGLSHDVHAQRRTRTRPSQTTTPPATSAAQTTDAQTTDANAGGDQKLRVRVDGLYYANVAADPTKPLYQYFRFYGDSTGVVNCCSSGAPRDVAKWLDKDHQSSQEGTYRVEDSKLIFIVGEERGAHTKYHGPLAADGWTLNADTPRPIKFMFAQVAFPREIVRPGQNRLPKVAPFVSKTDAFDYDPAGRVIGVTTTIEIKASDPDGDALTYTWTSTTGSIKGEGPKGVWSRPIVMGQAGPGIATVVVTDSKGGKTSRQFTY